MVTPGGGYQILFFNKDIFEVLLLQAGGTSQAGDAGSNDECIGLFGRHDVRFG